MAFGMEFFNKLVLSVFRIAAVIAIAYYLIRLVQRNYSFGFIACVALVFAGAMVVTAILAATTLPPISVIYSMPANLWLVHCCRFTMNDLSSN